MNASTRARAGRLAGFFGAPLVSLVTPLLLLPVLARTVDGEAWAAIAIGQSIGGLAQLVIGWGWPLYGPAAAAPPDPAARASIARQSLVERSMLLAAVAPPALVGAALLAPGPDSVVLTCLMALAGAVAGLSLAWFAAGVGRPSLTVRYELAPRVAAVVLAAAVVPLTGVPEAYPALLIAGSAAGVLAFRRREARGLRRDAIGRSRRARAAAMLTELAGGAYSVAVLAIASVVLSTAATAQLASADRIYRLAAFVIVASVAALQLSVHGGDPRSGRRRRGRAVLVHAAVGVTGGLLLAALGPIACVVLFGARLTPPTVTFWWYGAAFLMLSLNASVGRHVLVALDRLGAVLLSTVAGTVVGVSAILLLGPAGPPGVAAAVLLTETVVLLVQVVAVAAARPRRAQAPTRAGESARTPSLDLL